MSACSSFLGTTSIGLAQSLMLHNIMPASSNCLISWSTNSQYFGYSVGLVGDWRTFCRDVQLYQVSSCLCLLQSQRQCWCTSCLEALVVAPWLLLGSGIDLRGNLVLGSNCKLVPSGISGNNFAVLHCIWFQLTSWISSHFPASDSVVIGEFQDMLQNLLFVLNIGIFRFCGVLWSTLCGTSSGITPSGTWNVSMLSTYTLLVLQCVGVYPYN